MDSMIHVILFYEEKVRLIRTDSLTYAQYFDYRIKKLFSLLRSENSIFEEHDIVVHYIRVEFQQRGSPQVHC